LHIQHRHGRPDAGRRSPAGLAQAGAKTAVPFEKALEIAADACPSIRHPSKPKVSPGEFLAAASAARIAANSVK